MPTTYWSRSFLPTLKEAPADAVVASHRFLVRAAFLRQLGAGLYTELPLAKRTLAKIEAIVREEMDAVGAQEFHLPALHPADLWQQSGRWSVMGDNLFRLKDRKGTDHCLGMTHEELFTSLARELRSYRHLPQVWYQIQRKFRDEARPKSGLLRVREFTMKDAYSFDLDREGLDRAYEDQRRAYQRIFARCGLSFVAVKAHSGAMGGSESTEFMVKTDAGEDHVAACAACGYAANVETARSRGPIGAAVPGARHDVPQPFPTPRVRTIEALAAAPYQRPAAQQLKTLVLAVDGGLVLAVVRGDDTLNEAKLQSAVGTQQLRPAHPEEVRGLLGASPGSLGAVGVSAVPVWVDASLKGAAGMVTGANRDDVHLEGVDVDRDLGAARFVDLRTVSAGEGCPECGGALEVFKALEIGHIFKLGTRYSEALDVTVLDQDGQKRPIVMGSYGIGIGRILAAAVELHHDEMGIRWPVTIAPFQVEVLPLGAEPELADAARRLADELDAAGIEVLFDDRDERAGVKFKDADLVGIPLRVAVGKRGLESRTAELKVRGRDAAEMVPFDGVLARARELLRELAPKV